MASSWTGWQNSAPRKSRHHQAAHDAGPAMDPEHDEDRAERDQEVEGRQADDGDDGVEQQRHRQHGQQDQAEQVEAAGDDGVDRGQAVELGQQRGEVGRRQLGDERVVEVDEEAEPAVGGRGGQGGDGHPRQQRAGVVRAEAERPDHDPVAGPDDDQGERRQRDGAADLPELAHLAQVDGVLAAGLGQDVELRVQVLADEGRHGREQVDQEAADELLGGVGQRVGRVRLAPAPGRPAPAGRGAAGGGARRGGAQPSAWPTTGGPGDGSASGAARTGGAGASARPSASATAIRTGRR